MSKAKKINVDVMGDISGGVNGINFAVDVEFAGDQINSNDYIDTCEWNVCLDCGQGISGSRAWAKHKEHCPGHPVDDTSAAIRSTLDTKDTATSIINYI